jgi:hypothetical protein
MYLLDHLFPGKASGRIDPNKLYLLGDGYDLSQFEHLRLLIYLYTHCIIADTNYYYQVINPVRKESYLQMLARLETIIHDNYKRISLDNKLEFLVCSRICKFKTDLSLMINEECEASVSQLGTFLVDTQNDFAHLSTKKTLETSEHRNVLYIMSTIAPVRSY